MWNCFTCWCCATLLTFLLINVELMWKTKFADSVKCRFNSAFLLFSSSDMVLFLITAAKTLLNKKADVKVRTLTSPQLAAPWHDFPDRNMNSSLPNGFPLHSLPHPFSFFYLVSSVILNIIIMCELPSFSVSAEMYVLPCSFCVSPVWSPAFQKLPPF